MAIQKTEGAADRLASGCRDQIRSVIRAMQNGGWSYGTFSMDKKDTGAYVQYALTTGASTQATTDRPHRVTPIARFDPYDYWVSFVVEFSRMWDPARRQNMLAFTHASMSFFRGDPLDQNKLALLRAEWGCLDTYSTHAQPHWHLYPEGREGFQLSRSLFFQEEHPIQHTGEIEVEEFGAVVPVADFEAGEPPVDPINTARESDGEFPEPDEVDLTKMHFAMSAGWHHERGNDRVAVNEDGLRRWSGRCLSYVIGQIEHAFGTRRP